MLRGAFSATLSAVQRQIARGPMMMAKLAQDANSPPLAHDTVDSASAGTSAIVPYSASTELDASIPSILNIGQSGVPRFKKSVYLHKKKYTGDHFKHKFLRHEPWYYCPLCAEPKQPGTCCRREDCREMKP